MDDSNEIFQSDHLRAAWGLLQEYYDFCRLAHYRRKLEEQLRNAQIPLTRVSWKTLARRVLCSQLFSEDELKEMNGNSEDCCIESDIVASQAVVNILLGSCQEDGDREIDLTNAWFEVSELKQRFQKAASYIPSSRQARKDMCRKIQGYPAGNLH